MGELGNFGMFMDARDKSRALCCSRRTFLSYLVMLLFFVFITFMQKFNGMHMSSRRVFLWECICGQNAI